MFGSKSTAKRIWVICHPFPAYLLKNFTDFETHFQEKTTDVPDPVAFLFPLFPTTLSNLLVFPPAAGTAYSNH